jgi:hypothetical protein
MSMLAIQIEPHRRIRVFFDCRVAAVEPMDQRCIEQAIERSIVIAPVDDDASEFCFRRRGLIFRSRYVGLCLLKATLRLRLPERHTARSDTGVEDRAGDEPRRPDTPQVARIDKGRVSV